MEFDLFINVASISIASFLGVHFLLLGNRVNTFLGLFLVFTAISVLASEVSSPILHALGSPFLLAPLLLFFVLAITNNLNENKRNFSWLFLPAVLDSLSNFLFPEYSIVLRISVLLSSVFNLIVFYWMFLALKRHALNILNEFSALEGKRLIWLRNLVLVNIGFSILWLFDDTLSLVQGQNYVSDILMATSLYSTLLTILWIGFAGLRQFPIFEPVSTAAQPPQDPSPVVLPDLEIKFAELVERIEKKKLYLDSNLSLQDLAEALQIRNKELSQIINQGFGENFYHFINHFRIQYFKSLIQSGENEKMSLEGLAKETGFNSKSTFYAAFKKVEGMTPRAYILQQNQYK